MGTIPLLFSDRQKRRDKNEEWLEQTIYEYMWVVECVWNYRFLFCFRGLSWAVESISIFFEMSKLTYSIEEIKNWLGLWGWARFAEEFPKAEVLKIRAFLELGSFINK